MIQRTLIQGYCIDTSALIDLRNRFYPPDIFQSLWKDIEDLIKQGLLIAPQEVYDEISKKDDELLEWARRFKFMFENLDTFQSEEAKTVMTDFPNLVDPFKQIPDADPFVIALAKTKNWKVITSEKHGSSSHPKIPDACRRYGISCLSLIEFFRECGFKY